VRLEPSADGGLVLVLPGRRLAVPADDVPALTALLDGDAVQPGDLPGEGAVALVRRLLREGVLVLDDGPPVRP
jgi:hypothetical protein